MGKRSTIAGYWRQRGGTPSSTSTLAGPTPATFKAFMYCTVDPTAVLAGIGKTLPAGAIPLGVTPLGGGTGGIAPTIDVSLTGGAAGGLANELDADTASPIEVQTGAELGVALTADTEIQAGVGASVATGGVSAFLVSYIIADDGAIND